MSQTKNEPQKSEKPKSGETQTVEQIKKSTEDAAIRDKKSPTEVKDATAKLDLATMVRTSVDLQDEIRKTIANHDAMSLEEVIVWVDRLIDKSNVFLDVKESAKSKLDTVRRMVKYNMKNPPNEDKKPS